MQINILKHDNKPKILKKNLLQKNKNTNFNLCNQ